VHNRTNLGSPLELVAGHGAEMKFAIFGPAQVSGLGGGNARFLRGVCRELIARAHDVTLYPPQQPIDIARALEGVDVALVHDVTAPELVRRIRLHHASNGDYCLLFYDTHEREASAPPELRRFNLAGFDGVLGAGEVITQTYLARGWDSRVWTWHEAADTRSYAPHPGAARTADVVWIGDRHDLGASQDLGILVLEPARRLGLTGVIHGEQYPWRARLAIQRSGLRYGGPLAEHLVPAVWARHRFTVALPRLRHTLPGIPQTRVFEALASGIPLICTPWDDAEAMFTPGRDYLVARDQREMEAAMRNLRSDRAMAAELAEQGRATVQERHTCAHRVDELLAIIALLRAGSRETAGVLAAPARARLHGFSRKVGENSSDSDYGSTRQVGAR
jgi:spore maturation protein CgeB